MIITNNDYEVSSYKDLDARVFRKNNICYRQIFSQYIPTYTTLMKSGLYQELISNNLIVPHEEIENNTDEIIIKPSNVFITYPWEWAFSQLKDAALTTLKIQQIALKYNMSLKDANFFNIQFLNNTPLLIDTTSFEFYEPDQPWVAYKQFCENFLAPLALMTFVDIDMNNLLLSYPNGIPLKLASKLLPFKTKFNPNLYLHIHLHSKFQNKYEDNKQKIQKTNMPKNNLINLIDNLYTTIENLKLPDVKTQWGDYYNSTNYTNESFQNKKDIISKFKAKITINSVADFGANTGEFSRLFLDTATSIYSLDIDKYAVEQNYIFAKKNKEHNIFPLIFDIVTPSPAIGFINKERKSFLTRLQNVDLSIALALIHHLRFTYNLPFDNIAQFFSSISKYLIIEFIDKSDSQISKMLLNRKDIFYDYTQENFENIFSKYYKIIEISPIKTSKRTLYLMEKL